jgi:hypothetical protein
VPPDRRLFELWHYGAKRCRVSPREAPAPFAVVISDGEASEQRTFDDHETAIAYAVEQLRLATTTHS